MSESPSWSQQINVCSAANQECAVDHLTNQGSSPLISLFTARFGLGFGFQLPNYPITRLPNSQQERVCLHQQRVQNSRHRVHNGFRSFPRCPLFEPAPIVVRKIVFPQNTWRTPDAAAHARTRCHHWTSRWTWTVSSSMRLCRTHAFQYLSTSGQTGVDHAA